MRLSHWKPSLLTSFAVFGMMTVSPTYAQAVQEAHGGGAVVCRNPSNGSIRSVELLDVWEAELEGWKPQDAQQGFDRLTQVLLDRLSLLNPEFAEHVKQALPEIMAMRKDVPSGVGIVPPDDARNNLIKEGCSLEGVARFVTATTNPVGTPRPDTLYVNPRLYEKMDPLSQAALWIHEAIYKVLRDMENAKDSVLTRQLVAAISSSHSLAGTGVFGKIPDHGYFSCRLLRQSPASKIKGTVRVGFDGQLIQFAFSHLPTGWQFAPQPSLTSSDTSFVPYWGQLIPPPRPHSKLHMFVSHQGYTIRLAQWFLAAESERLCFAEDTYCVLRPSVSIALDQSMREVLAFTQCQFVP